MQRTSTLIPGSRSSLHSRSNGGKINQESKERQIPKPRAKTLFNPRTQQSLTKTTIIKQSTLTNKTAKHKTDPAQSKDRGTKGVKKANERNALSNLTNSPIVRPTVPVVRSNSISPSAVTKEKVASAAGDDDFGQNDIEFEVDPSALASIMNNEGITDNMVKDIANTDTNQERPSLLLPDGRPSLCRRVPIKPVASTTSRDEQGRVSVGPRRVLVTNARRASAISTARSSWQPRNSLYSSNRKPELTSSRHSMYTGSSGRGTTSGRGAKVNMMSQQRHSTYDGKRQQLCSATQRPSTLIGANKSKEAVQVQEAKEKSVAAFRSPGRVRNEVRISASPVFRVAVQQSPSTPPPSRVQRSNRGSARRGVKWADENSVAVQNKLAIHLFGESPAPSNKQQAATPVSILRQGNNSKRKVFRHDPGGKTPDPEKQEEEESCEIEIVEPCVLNSPQLSSLASSAPSSGRVDKEAPPSDDVIGIDEVLKLMNRQLSKVKRRSVQDAFSDVIRQFGRQIGRDDVVFDVIQEEDDADVACEDGSGGEKSKTEVVVDTDDRQPTGSDVIDDTRAASEMDVRDGPSSQMDGSFYELSRETKRIQDELSRLRLHREKLDEFKHKVTKKTEPASKVAAASSHDVNHRVTSSLDNFMSRDVINNYTIDAPVKEHVVAPRSIVEYFAQTRDSPTIRPRSPLQLVPLTSQATTMTSQPVTSRQMMTSQVPIATPEATRPQLPVMTSPPTITSQPILPQPMTSHPLIMSSQPPMMTSQLPMMTSQPPMRTSQLPMRTSQLPMMTSQLPMMTSQSSQNNDQLLSSTRMRDEVRHLAEMLERDRVEAMIVQPSTNQHEAASSRDLDTFMTSKDSGRLLQSAAMTSRSWDGSVMTSRSSNVQESVPMTSRSDNGPVTFRPWETDVMTSRPMTSRNNATSQSWDSGVVTSRLNSGEVMTSQSDSGMTSDSGVMTSRQADSSVVTSRSWSEELAEYKHQSPLFRVPAIPPPRGVNIARKSHNAPRGDFPPPTPPSTAPSGEFPPTTPASTLSGGVTTSTLSTPPSNLPTPQGNSTWNHHSTDSPRFFAAPPGTFPIMAAPVPQRQPMQTPVAFRALRSHWVKARHSPYKESPKATYRAQFAQALLDEEVSLFTCRLPQTRKWTSPRHDPVARSLDYGDDQHFVPISCRTPVAHKSPPDGAIQLPTSAFSQFCA